MIAPARRGLQPNFSHSRSGEEDGSSRSSNGQEATHEVNRFALALTVVNILAMLGFWSQMQVAGAQAVPDLLRAKGLEILDDRGIVRAQIIVQPNNGGVLFRLIDQQQKPLVKLGAGADGSGLMLTGDPTTRDWSGIQVMAKPGGSTLRLLKLIG